MIENINSITNYDIYEKNPDYKKQQETNRQIGNLKLKIVKYQKKLSFSESLKQIVTTAFEIFHSLVFLRPKAHAGNLIKQSFSGLGKEKIMTICLAQLPAVKLTPANPLSNPIEKLSAIDLPKPNPTPFSSAISAPEEPSSPPVNELATLLDALGWQETDNKKLYMTKSGFLFHIQLFVSYLTKENFEGFTGIFNDEILLRGATDLNTLIKLLNLQDLHDLEMKLKEKQKLMSELKMLYQEWAFSPDLLDCLSLTCIMLNHPKAFGCKVVDKEDDGESATFRFKALSEAYKSLNRYCKATNGKARRFEHVYNFPVTLTPKDHEQFVLARKKAGFNSRLISPSLPKSVELAQNFELCLNDSLPSWFRTWYPYGMHLVTTENDERTENEKFNSLGAIAQQMFVIPCQPVNVQDSFKG